MSVLISYRRMYFTPTVFTLSVAGVMARLPNGMLSLAMVLVAARATGSFAVARGTRAFQLVLRSAGLAVAWGLPATAGPLWLLVVLLPRAGLLLNPAIAAHFSTMAMWRPSRRWPRPPAG